METELRDQLREAADEMRLDGEVPGPVSRRARRRRVGIAALAAGVAVGLVVGGLFGVRAVLEAERAAVPGGGRGGDRAGSDRPEARPVWPHESIEDARRDQALADRGFEQVTWERDLRQVVERFIGEQGWGWEPLFIDPDPSSFDADEAGPVVLYVGDCEGVATDSCPNEATLVLQRLVRPDRTGVWSIITQTAHGPGGVNIEPSPAPVIPTPTPRQGAVGPAGELIPEDFVLDFLEHRVEGAGAEAFLSTYALRQYREGESGLELYSPAYDRSEITSVRAADADSYEVTVGLIEERPDGCVHEIYESLLVGSGPGFPGFDPNREGAPLIVRLALRDDVESESCP